MVPWTPARTSERLRFRYRLNYLPLTTQPLKTLASLATCATDARALVHLIEHAGTRLGHDAELLRTPRGVM